MDYIRHFHREVQAFEKVSRRAAAEDTAPMIPSCPEWTMSDIIVHLGWVHRFVALILRDHIQEPPQITDTGFLGLPPEAEHWPRPENAPGTGPIPAGLIDWFSEGAATLESLFADRDPGERVWTWSAEQSVGFWLRMQTIEAAIHRWDAENALGPPEPVDAELAVDAIDQNFAVMVPRRRAQEHTAKGAGERYRFRQSDGPRAWTVGFEGGTVQLGGDSFDVELIGTASDLMLFLWQRLPADRLTVNGDRDVLDRYFALVPPE